MNIGIDVDGTMTDISGFMLKNGTKYFGREASEPAAFLMRAESSSTGHPCSPVWRKRAMSSSSLRELRPWRSIFSRGMSCSSGAVVGDSMGWLRSFSV